jgi:hypothetical protein
MSEAAVFVSLSASVDQKHQAVALSGLFLAANIGVITGLTGASSVLEITVRSELEKNLASYPNKDQVNIPDLKPAPDD